MERSFIRLLVGLFAPALIGTALLFCDMLLDGNSSLEWSVIEGYFLWSLFAFVIIGVQSLIYSLLMEFVVNRKLKSNFLVVALSTLFGALAGSVQISGDAQLSLFTTIGAITGLILGVLLRSMYLVSANKQVVRD